MPVLNPDERAQEVQWITGSGPASQAQVLPAYAPNADAQAAALAREVVAAQQPVARPGGWIAPVGRERYVANPYYTSQGSTDLYNRTGLMPTIYQSNPYATASYAVGADGSVSGLVGFPSRYPHVINLGFHDYTMPFMAAWSPYMYQGLQLMQAARAAAPGGGIGVGAGTGIRRGGASVNARTPAKTAASDIRTSTDRGPYPGWNGPMSEEELAIQRATQQVSNSPVLPEEPGLWQRDPSFGVPHYGGGTSVQANPQVTAPSAVVPDVANGLDLESALLDPEVADAIEAAGDTSALANAIRLSTPQTTKQQLAGGLYNALDNAASQYIYPLLQSARNAISEWTGEIPISAQQVVAPLLGEQYNVLTRTPEGRALILDLARDPDIANRIIRDRMFINSVASRALEQ